MYKLILTCHLHFMDEETEANGETGEAYNLAGVESDVTLADLASYIAQTAGTKVIFNIPDEIESAGLIPKFSAILTTIPQCVLGGATVSVFSSIAMTGMKLVSSGDMNHRNTSIVGLAAALGVGISQVTEALAQFPDWVTMVFAKSPVVVATIVAVALNVILPKEKTEEK